MSKLSWKEIRDRAVQFSHQFQHVKDERAEAQSFWNAFFHVFGLRRELVATFEEKVKSLKGTDHRIDVFWPGTLLGEHKSQGQSLDKAHAQAFNYIQELANTQRAHEIPRYVVVSDFRRIVLFDMNPDRDPNGTYAEPYERHEFALADFHHHVKQFAFLIGQQTVRFRNEDDANLDAAKLMADLHDVVEAGGYQGHALERLLVRLLFCLFADDTGIWDTNQFEFYLKHRAREDGSDLGMHLQALFEILDTPMDQRQKGLDEELAAFPYINGDLFGERHPMVAFNRDMKNRLMAAAAFNWGRISPAVFGSLFQGIMDAKERRQVGAHYTSERDILKLIRPLFLDGLCEEFEQIKALKQKNVRDQRLIEFQAKLAGLKFLDPACGCGNFLVIAYRELRRLELELLLLRYPKAHQQQELPQGEVAKLSKVDVSQFYGIEIDEWPARIAETALWLTDHQMNNELSLAFGNQFMRIPLKASPHIQCANALRMDWNELLPAKECNFVLGNPPFVGKKARNRTQQLDMEHIFGSDRGAGVLDYVACWYMRAAQYIRNTHISCAFVSTNSITQGEQVGILWSTVWSPHNLEIAFAYRTFSWQSEARGGAHVHVVIIGFQHGGAPVKTLFDEVSGTDAPTASIVANINLYLLNAGDVVVMNRATPLCDVPRASFGSMPNDDGQLILSSEEKALLVGQQSEVEKLLLPLLSAKEYLNGLERWCIWLNDVSPSAFSKIVEIRERIEAVRIFRSASSREATRRLALQPSVFGEIREPVGSFILIPCHSSERRHYIPFSFISMRSVVHNSCLFIDAASIFHFGILTSALHMAWVKNVCGRIKSDYRYSAKLVYNNFPWPASPTPEQRAKVEACALAVLDARQGHLDAGSTLADLYDPNTMPVGLLKAHQALDKAVDRCYRAATFTSERERVEYLFGLYEQLTAPLAVSASPAKKKRTKRGG